MKNTLGLSLVIVLLLVTQSYALIQGSYMFVSLSYWRGWVPYDRVVYKGETNLCGCSSLDDGMCQAKCTNVNGNYDVDKCPFQGTSLMECEPPATTWPGWVGVIGIITIPDDLKIVKEDGTVVEDELCLGESFSFSQGVLKGEYWNDGGHGDSPPIYWVDDVEAVFDKILDAHRKGRVAGTGRAAPVQDGYVDPLTGIPVVSMMVGTGNGNSGSGVPSKGSAGYSMTGSMVCSLKKVRMDIKGASSEGKYYRITESSGVKIDGLLVADCMYYYFSSVPYDQAGREKEVMVVKVPTVIQAKDAHGSDDSVTENVLYNSKQDFFRVGNITVRKDIRVTSPVKPQIDLEILGDDDIKFSENNNLRILVKNKAGTDINVMFIGSKSGGNLVSCDKETIPVGSVGECIFAVTPRLGSGLDVQVSYEYKTCGKTYVGVASKVLLESKAVAPKASVQVYSVGVHEGCENNYYGCVPADREGNFVAGYECYNQNDQFYSAGKERFVLKYELPELTSKSILGASLNLAVGKVNKPQTLSLYSVKSGWEPAVCRAGGDICTQPYCGECKDLFDMSGNLLAETEAKSMGLISFDISDGIKAAYAGGNKVLSFQVRGEEDLWETGGMGSCGGTNAWSEQDVEVQGPGGRQPYLEIVYK